jgi:hypothetical protein
MSRYPVRALISGAALLGVAGLIAGSPPMALAAGRAASRVPAAQIIVTPAAEPAGGAAPRHVVRVAAPQIIITPIEEP